MWLNKRDISKVIGNDMTRKILANVHASYTRDLFKKDVRVTLVNEYHWKADRDISARKDMVYIHIDTAIKAYKYLVSNGSSRYATQYKEKLRAIKDVKNYYAN